ncbi:fatty acid--CoA ligase [Rhabdobacter roseus]|uniref:Fatty-acyl-CoA synthase n=1 Tax=Rhabdobacter roseus TaxID=1655419 RepID=A0A840TND6_9BACT|nr:fatty acid--CoA ligase [Rhabdobacter roseus]MBB5283062.1 fatty-acyl-CoA synthase [Rhabdobacter roseus]
MIETKVIPRTESAYDSPLLIKNILAQSVRYNPEREIVYRDLFRMNYLTLNQRIHRLANALTGLGIGPGDTVGMLDWDSHRYLECFFAVPCMGAILHTVNVRLSPAQILYTINHAEDTILLVHEDFLPILEAIKDQITTVRTYVLISDRVYGDAPEAVTTTAVEAAGEYEQLLAEAADAFEFPDFDENTWATSFYTTGTTGNPKGVYFSHRQLFMHTMGLVSYFCGFEALPFSHRDVYMPITPMFHVHAWGFPYVATMLNAKQVYPGRYEPPMLLNLLLTEKVTFSHCVPTILNMLVQSPVAKQVDLSNWKVIIGGSALTRGLAQAALELGINVSQGYGMSETAPVMAVVHLNEEQLQLPLEEQLAYRTKAGKMAPFVELRLVDEQGTFLPHDGQATGEVVARSPWMTQGYFKEPENSEKLWENGWLHTGDVGSLGPDYYLTISDRVKDVIKTGGEWVSSLDLENLLSQVEGVAEVAVVGMPDARWGERPNALVVPKPDFQDLLTAELIKQQMQRFVESGEIKPWYIPDRILFVPDIPKTSVGKIDKKKIRVDLTI